MWFTVLVCHRGSSSCITINFVSQNSLRGFLSLAHSFPFPVQSQPLYIPLLGSTQILFFPSPTSTFPSSQILLLTTKMAKSIAFSSLLFIFVSLVINDVFSLELSQQLSPSPSPESPENSPPLPSPTPFPHAPASSLVESPLHSPPAPPPSDLTPTPSPAPVPSLPPTPSPSPTADSDFSNSTSTGGGEDSEASKGGMNGGKKAGIAVGVIAAVCFVGIGGFVYKKRQDNIRRSQYGSAARSSFL